MSLEQNFLYDNFKNYQEKGVKSLKEGNNAEAKKYLLKAAEALFKLAEAHKERKQSPETIQKRKDTIAFNKLKKKEAGL